MRLGEYDEVTGNLITDADTMKRRYKLVKLADLKEYVEEYPEEKEELTRGLVAIWAQPKIDTFIPRKGYLRLVYDLKAPLNLPKFLGTIERATRPLTCRPR